MLTINSARCRPTIGHDHALVMCMIGMIGGQSLEWTQVERSHDTDITGKLSRLTLTDVGNT